MEFPPYITYLIVLLFLSVCRLELYSTPTSLFWTNCITDVQATGTCELQEYSYFSVFNRHRKGSAFPPDIGLLLGLFTIRDLSAEFGVDYYGGADNPLYFNGKVGMKEGGLFCGSPSFSFGMFNAGLRAGKTNQNVLNFVLGKSLPYNKGTLYTAFYSGSQVLGKNRQGCMFGFKKGFCKKNYCDDTEYFQWTFAGDYASGKNAIGGGGIALLYNFTPDISVETGPVWFNDAKINGKWKWSLQFYLSFPLFDPPKCLNDLKTKEAPKNDKKDEDKGYG